MFTVDTLQAAVEQEPIDLCEQLRVVEKEIAARMDIFRRLEGEKADIAWDLEGTRLTDAQRQELVGESQRLDRDMAWRPVRQLRDVTVCDLYLLLMRECNDSHVALKTVGNFHRNPAVAHLLAQDPPATRQEAISTVVDEMLRRATIAAHISGGFIPIDMYGKVTSTLRIRYAKQSPEDPALTKA